ncbi:MAG: 4Fe-4S binding protein [Syntrophomonadaceae bacterium]|nr:4Fe-4S binding protein [Syntrophomonadaceae bacterium]
MPREKDKEWVEGFAEQVDQFGLVGNLEACLACGKCVGNCPVAAITPSYNSRQIIRDIVMGNAGRLLKSEEIWRCFWCANCYQSCPMDIHFPLLMMQLRYKAIENNYGFKYVLPFKRFALKAREEAMTFTPGAKGRERIMQVRSQAGMTPWPEISERAQKEYQALFDLTGTTAWLEALDEEAERPVVFTYREGRISHE